MSDNIDSDDEIEFSSDYSEEKKVHFGYTEVVYFYENDTVSEFKESLDDQL